MSPDQIETLRRVLDAMVAARDDLVAMLKETDIDHSSE